MMPRIMSVDAVLIMVFAVLALVVALLGSRYYRLVLGVLGALVGGLVALAALYLVQGTPSRNQLVMGSVQERWAPQEPAWPRESRNRETVPRNSSQPPEPAREGTYRVQVADGPSGPSDAQPSRQAASAVPSSSASQAPLEQIRAEQGPGASPDGESIDSPAAALASEAVAPYARAPEALPDAPGGGLRLEQDAATFGEPQSMLGERQAGSGEATQMGSRSAVMQPPKWLTAPTGKQADGSYRLIVKSGPFKTRIECDKELRPIVAQEVDDYVELLLGREAVRQAMGDRFRGSTLLSARELDGLVRDTWLEHGEAAYPVGDVVTLHALVVFTPQIQSRIDSRFREQVSQRRAFQAIVGSVGLLGLLATVYGYLRFDMLTRGYYTGRLRLAAVATILAIVGGTAAYFLA